MSNPQETQEFIAGLKAWKWMMGLLQKKILGVSFYCQPYWFLPEGSTYCFLEKGWVCWYLFHSKKTPFGTTRLPIPTLGCLNPGRSTWKRRKNGRINFHRKKNCRTPQLEGDEKSWKLKQSQNKKNTKHFFVLKLKYHMDFQFTLPILCRHGRIWNVTKRKPTGTEPPRL